MPSFVGESSHWKHGRAAVSDDVKIHYVDVAPSNPNGHNLTLIHGFPQTWYEFRHIIQPLADEGYRVIAIDYRGAGDSNRPYGGYDKFTMAEDIYLTLKETLQVKESIILGHDIGSMVAVCFALRYRDFTEALICMEAPQPGTEQYDTVTRDDKYTYAGLYHFFFHTQPDLPELLTQGKEREYIYSFFERLCFNPSFLSRDDLDHYGQAFSQPGALRAGFDCYRAFRRDRENFRSHMKENGKIQMPVLAMAGDASMMVAWFEKQTKEFAEHVTFKVLSNSGHWMAEENPSEFVQIVKDFLALDW